MTTCLSTVKAFILAAESKDVDTSFSFTWQLHVVWEQTEFMTLRHLSAVWRRPDLMESACSKRHLSPKAMKRLFMALHLHLSIQALRWQAVPARMGLTKRLKRHRLHTKGILVLRVHVLDVVIRPHKTLNFGFQKDGSLWLPGILFILNLCSSYCF